MCVGFRSAARIFFAGFLAVAEALFFSCGLEEIITVNEPKTTYIDPLYNSNEPLSWYCSFATEEGGQPDSFVGTEVYYKIYNNTTNLLSQRSAINSVNTTSNASTAATRLITTYSFQPLSVYPPVSGQSVFAPKNGANTRITFRPKSRAGSESYSGDSFESFRACVKYWGQLRGFVSGASGLMYLYYDSGTDGWSYSASYNESGSGYTAVDYYDIRFLVPYRSNGKSFDFFDELDTDLDENVEPEEGDDDYYHNATASAEKTYYVQFFAVAVAFDTANLTNSYSLVLDLGSIPIIDDQ